MPEITSSRYLVNAGWQDVPHLTEQAKSELLASTSPHTHDARSKGTPSLGAGAIYPIPEADIICKPFAIPAYWPKIYGLDVGWVCTAAVFLAHDRDVDIVYAYTEHYRGQAEPPTHATAIKARGDWVPGTIDPSSRNRSLKDGEELMAVYLGLGLHLIPAQHAVEAGLLAVLTRMATGRLKIFSTCQNTLAELRMYRRNEKGVIVKKFDHAMDGLRYGIMMLQHAKVQVVAELAYQRHVADLTVGL